MAYSVVGFLAIAIHFIVNIDVFLHFRGKKKFSGELFYFFFLISVIAYHVTDGFWGILYDNHLITALFIDTTAYFIIMATSILLWGLFVYRYLGSKNKIITYIGLAVFTFQIAVIIANFFYPVLFVIDENCEYSAKAVRYVMLGIQVFMFLLLAIYTFITFLHSNGSLKRHHLAISIFCLFMIASIALQVFFPLMPLYSLGYLLGVTALHTFVVEDEKANQKLELEEAKHRVSIDPLTGVMSKYAYIDEEAHIDDLIARGEMKEFAMIVFDLNDLKFINDTKGHDAGDIYIIQSVNLIKEYFKDIPIYRVGGDEFTIILRDNNYDNRDGLFKAFNDRIDENSAKNDLIIISAGLAIYLPDKDSTILQTYTRADREMYARKYYLKEHKNN